MISYLNLAATVATGDHEIFSPAISTKKDQIIYIQIYTDFLLAKKIMNF